MARSTSTPKFTIKDFHSTVNRLNNGRNISGIIGKLNYDVLVAFKGAITDGVLKEAMSRKKVEDEQIKLAASKGKLKEAAKAAKAYAKSSGLPLDESTIRKIVEEAIR